MNLSNLLLLESHELLLELIQVVKTTEKVSEFDCNVVISKTMQIPR